MEFNNLIMNRDAPLVERDDELNRHMSTNLNLSENNNNNTDVLLDTLKEEDDDEEPILSSSVSSDSSDSTVNVEENVDKSYNNTSNEDSITSSTSPPPCITPTEYVAGCFEGPEKTMEVQFRPGIGKNEQGLRSLSRTQLNAICTAAKCSILSHIQSNHIDAYVLSESSLFVYKYKLVMKTCGTTTLLRCLGLILQYADELDMQLTWLEYSRKNLFYPDAQQWPHNSFGEEIRFLDTHEKLQDRLKGSGYILGPVTGDHWFVYVADHDPTASIKIDEGIVLTNATTPYLSPVTQDRCINLMMFDMAPEVAALFFKTNVNNAKEMTIRSGISQLCPGAEIDEHSFEPCGYSMNAILHDAYSTIHVTPEPECSYVSFETNTSLKSYRAMVRNVISVFRPKRFVLTMFGDEADIRTLDENPTSQKMIDLKNYGLYQQTSNASSNLNSEMVCYMANYKFQSNNQLLNQQTRVKGETGTTDLPPSEPKAVFPFGYRQPHRSRGHSLGS